MKTLVIVITSVGFIFDIEKTAEIPMETGCEEVAKQLHQINENTVVYCINKE